MDVGKFKSSQRRLMMWIVVPPLLIVGVGLSSHAWQQRTEWKLKQAKALSEVLPTVIEVQRETAELIADLGLNNGNAIKSEDQLISLLQEAALENGFIIDAVQVVRREAKDARGVPMLSAHVAGTGGFAEVQLFINDVQSRQHMLAVNTLELSQAGQEVIASDGFKASISFDLMLVDEVLKTSGGMK